MALSHFRMLNNEVTKKDQDVVPYQAPLIVLDNMSEVCMYNNDKYNKQTIHISRKIHFVKMVKSAIYKR